MNKFIKLVLATGCIVFIAKAAKVYGRIEMIEIYDKDHTQFEELRKHVYNMQYHIDAAKKMMFKKK